jgi:hypothetical protein
LPLATYSDLKAEIASWLRRDDLAAEIPSFIALVEAQMNRRLRVRPMAARASQTWAAEYADLPADFLVERELKLTANGAVHPLTYLTAEQMDGRTVLTGRPRFYALYGTQLRLSPAPDASYAGEMVYLQAIPALSDAEPSNWLLQSHPDAYLYGALTQSAPYLRADERLQTWGVLFTTVLADIEAADRTGTAARLRGETPGRRRTFDIIRG